MIYSYSVEVYHVRICDADKHKLECMTEGEIREYIYEHGARFRERYSFYFSLDEARNAFEKECEKARVFLVKDKIYTLIVDYIELQEIREYEIQEIINWESDGIIETIDDFVAKIKME